MFILVEHHNDPYSETWLYAFAFFSNVLVDLYFVLYKNNYYKTFSIKVHVKTEINEFCDIGID